MALKTLLIMSLLIIAIAFPMAKAQLGRLGLLNIQGTLYCTHDGNIAKNGTSTPVFSNAEVQLQCGPNIVSATTTNNVGVFSMVLDPLGFLLSSLLSGCGIAVATPLSNCSVALPSVGHLWSPLKVIGNSIIGGLFVTNIIPIGFQYQP